MKTTRALLWIGLIGTLILAGCRGGGQPTAVGEPEVAPTNTAEPVVVPDDTPVPTVDVNALPPSLYLDPAVVDLTPGEARAVNVWIDSAQRLHGVALELSFDPAIVEVVDANSETDGVQVAPAAIPQPANVVRNEVVVGEGRIFYEVNQAAGTSTDGNGAVATITFRGLTAGISQLAFENVSAWDPDGNEIVVMPMADGMIRIMAAEPSATPEATAAPTEAPTAQPTAGAAPTPAPAPATGYGIYYVVQPGENIFRIGLKFNVTVDAIAAASGLANPNAIRAGTLVLVPVRLPQGGYGYYVQPRDTAYSIARRFGMTVENLVALNGIGANYAIQPGQILSVQP